MTECVIIEIMLKEHIIKKIQTALTKIHFQQNDIAVDTPTNPQFGDYTTNIAMRLAKELKKNPIQVAEEIIAHIPSDEVIQKVEVIKPGFINIFITSHVLLESMINAAKKNFAFPQHHIGKNKKIMIEFAHPNTHKLFHIGHLRNITTGEAISRLLEAVGNTIIRANYQGDVGLHIAKCLWKIKQIIEEKSLEQIHNLPLQDRIALLGKAYSEGNTAYETNEDAKKEIIEINKMIYEQNPIIKPIWEETRNWSLEYFESIYNKVYTKYDRLFFESQMAQRGLEISKEAVQNGILEESEGAIVLNGKKYGIDTRVFVNSLGLPTYEGKELGLAEKEFTEFGEIDKCIHVLGGEQKSFTTVTFKVQELINPERYKDRQYHLVYGWVDLIGQKMSSRKGNIVEGEWLINEAKRQIVETYKSNDDVAEVLAIAAVKYSFLKNATQTAVNFDLSEAITLQGDSGPYLVYTYVRCKSVLEKEKIQFLTTKQLEEVAMNEDESTILRTLFKYPEIVHRAAQQYAPNYIANYLFELAQQYNLFYQKHQILKAEADIKSFRLMLTQAVASVLHHGLYLLGIQTVEKM